MNYQALYTETQLSAYSGMTDKEIAQAINGATVDYTKNVKVADLVRYFEQQGIAATLDVIAADSNHALFGAAKTVMRQLSGVLPDIDVTHAVVIQLFDGLISAGVMTAAQKMAVLAMGVETRPRAHLFDVARVNVAHIAQAKARYGS